MMRVQDRYYWLDVIRFLSAFLVLVAHFRGAFFVEYGMLPEADKGIGSFLFFSITRLGHEAVLVFFVLSGFLVGGKTIDRIRNNTFDIRSYSIDRGVRIMLPLFSATLLVIMDNMIRGISNDWSIIIGNLLSLQGVIVPPSVEPLWSLSYEVWFYIFIGCIGVIFMTSDKKTKNLSPIIILLILGCMVFTKLNPIYLIVWLVGAFAYIIPLPRKNTWKMLLWLSLVLCSCVLLQIKSESRSLEALPWKYYLPNKQCCELLFTFAFVGFMRQIVQFVPKTRVSALLNRWGTTLAAFSYTLYLTHMQVRNLLLYIGFPKSQSFNVQTISLLFVELIIALSFAYGIYWCFEKRTKIVKDKLKMRFIKSN